MRVKLSAQSMGCKVTLALRARSFEVELAPEPLVTTTDDMLQRSGVRRRSEGNSGAGEWVGAFSGERSK